MPTPAPTSKKMWWRRLLRTELLCPSLRCRKRCHLPLRRGPPWGPTVAPRCLKESGGRSLRLVHRGAKRLKRSEVGVTRHWLPPLPPRKPVTVGGEAAARPGTRSPWSQTAVAGPPCIRTRGPCHHAPQFEPGTPGQREVRGIFYTRSPGRRGTITKMLSVTTRSVFAPAVRAPAPAPTLSPLTARSDPSFRGRGSSLGRRSPGRPPSWSSPSSCRTSLASLVSQAGALEEDGAPVGRVRPGAERKANPKRPISNRLSQRGPAGQVVTLPESAAGCGRSVPHPSTHR